MARFPRYLNSQEIDTILNFTNPNHPLGVSVRLGLFIGLRVGEMAKITRTDIKRALLTGMFTVRKDIAKYGKSRTIPVCETLANSLADWYNKHSTFNVKHLTLWNCSLRTVQRRFAELIPYCKFKFTPHDLRHTFACCLYSKSRDLSLVQAALGHKTLKTTLVYVHIEGILQKEIEEAYESFTQLPIRRRYYDKIK
jgi:integrase/recombinase XerC